MAIFNLNFTKISAFSQAHTIRGGFLLIELLVAMAILINCIVLYATWAGTLALLKKKVTTDLIYLHQSRNITVYRIHNAALFESYVREIQLNKIQYIPIAHIKTDLISNFSIPQGLHELVMNINQSSEHRVKRITIACLL